MNQVMCSGPNVIMFTAAVAFPTVLTPKDLPDSKSKVTFVFSV